MRVEEIARLKAKVRELKKKSDDLEERASWNMFPDMMGKIKEWKSE